MPPLYRRETLAHAINDYIARLDSKLSYYTSEVHEGLIASCLLSNASLEPIYEALVFVKAIVISAESITIVHGSYLEKTGNERILFAIPAVLDRANQALTAIEACVASFHG